MYCTNIMKWGSNARNQWKPTGKNQILKWVIDLIFYYNWFTCIAHLKTRNCYVCDLLCGETVQVEYVIGDISNVHLFSCDTLSSKLKVECAFVCILHIMPYTGGYTVCESLVILHQLGEEDMDLPSYK